MIYIGWLLGAWLIFGLFYGIHVLYVEQLWDALKEDSVEQLKTMDEGKDFYEIAFKSKTNLMIVMILFGGALIIIEQYHKWNDRRDKNEEN